MKLAEIARHSKTAKRIFDNLSSRIRFRSVTDLRHLYYTLDKEAEVDPVEFMNTFKRLEALGIGKISQGDGETADKFFWKYNLKEIAEAAQKGQGFEHLKPLKDRVKRKLDSPIIKAINEVKRREREEARRLADLEEEQEKLSARRKKAKKGQDKPADMYKELLSKMSAEDLQALLLEAIKKQSS